MCPGWVFSWVLRDTTRGEEHSFPPHPILPPPIPNPQTSLDSVLPPSWAKGSSHLQVKRPPFNFSQLMTAEVKGQMGHLPSLSSGEGESGGKRSSAQKLGLAQFESK